MTRALGVALLGLLLVAMGFVLSPWPWVAPVAPGVVLCALGVFYLFRVEVE